MSHTLDPEKTDKDVVAHHAPNDVDGKVRDLDHEETQQVCL